MRIKPWLALTIIAAGILYALAIDSQLDLNGDSPRFVMLARSIHDGKGYNGTFTFQNYPETQIPYLYPLMLVPVISLAGPNGYAAFKLLSVLCMMAALAGLFFWISNWLPTEDASWVVIVAACLAQIQLNADHIATEAPYLAASFFCLGFMEKSVREPGRFRNLLIVVILAGIGFHLRAAGWSLLATFVLALLLQRRWKDAAISTVLGVAACLPWLIRLAQFGFGYSTEFEQSTPSSFAAIYRFVYNIAADTTKALPDLFLYPFLAPYLPYTRAFFVKAAIGVIILAAMLWGIRSYIRSRQASPIRPTEIYFVAYLAGAMTWTVSGERYLLPAFPILLWALLRGFGRWRRETAVVLATIGLAGCLLTVYRVRLGIRSPEEEGYIQAVQWLGAHASPEDHVLSRYPTWVAAVTGNRGARWEETDDLNVQRKTIMADSIQWVILDHNKVFRETGAERLTPLIEHEPEHFHLEYTSPQMPPTLVYRFTP